MPRSLDHPNWDEGHELYFEYDSSVPMFSPLTHSMLSPGTGWGRETDIESRPMQPVQDSIPSEHTVSMIGSVPLRMLPMAHGSNRATATSAGAPNHHITSNLNPRYTPSVNGAPVTSIDCTLASAADAGEYGPSSEICHPAGRATLPPDFGQHRAIQKRSDAHKHPSKTSAKYPMKCKWEGCAYPGSFKQESSLIRHLRNFHFAPLAHPCPFDNCDKVCNRGDNLTQHIRNHHHCH